MPEQRRFERFGHRFPLEVEYVFDRALRRETTQLINISAGGALLPVGVFLMPGKKIDIEIDVPQGAVFNQVMYIDEPETANGKAIRAAGEVVRTEFKPEHPGKFCTAVRFLEGFRIDDSPGPAKK